MPETMDKSTEYSFDEFTREIKEAWRFLQKDARRVFALSKMPPPEDLEEAIAVLSLFGGIQADIEQIERAIAKFREASARRWAESTANDDFEGLTDFDNLKFIEC